MNLQYDQVPGLVDSGFLNWETSLIKALLVTDASFVSTQQRVSDVDVYVLGKAVVQGRVVVDGNCYGLPVIFPRSAPGVVYQVLVVLDDATGDPLLLSYTDTDNLDNQITVQRVGLVDHPSHAGRDRWHQASPGHLVDCVKHRYGGMMASLAELTRGTRQLVRDFPQYFEIGEGPLNVLTIRLPHPYVSAPTLQVYVATVEDIGTSTTALVNDWSLDERNGLLKLDNADYLNKQITVAGYHYTWFSDEDIARYVNNVSLEQFYGRPGMSLDNMTDVEAEVLEIGAVVRLLWSLCLELALDIDVSTPEGMFIPAHQRYQQVLQMMQYWENEYTQKSESLNVGLGALQIFWLRRVSYTTNRLVPVYREREIDDPTFPDRLYLPIPAGTMPDDAQGSPFIDPLTGEQMVSTYDESAFDLGATWTSIGTRGDSF